MIDSDALILENLRLVDHIVMLMKARRRVPAHHAIEDMRADGLFGLVQAARSFEPDKAAKFSTFAWYRIKGAIIDGVRARFDTRAAHKKRALIVSIDEAEHETLSDERALAEMMRVEARVDAERIVDRVDACEDLVKSHFVDGETIEDTFNQFSRSWASRVAKRCLERMHGAATARSHD